MSAGPLARPAPAFVRALVRALVTSLAAGLLLAGFGAGCGAERDGPGAGAGAVDPAVDLAAFPDPRRLEGEIRAFEEADRVSPPAPGGIVAVGSSSLRFWHDAIRDDLAPLPIVPRGFGGSTYLDALRFADRIVLPYRPRAVLVYEGDNDVDFGAEPVAVVAVYRAFAERVRRELPGTRFYVMSIKPSPARWDRWPAMREANRLLERECAADPLAAWIDVATPMLGADGRPRPELFLEDRLHLNRQGYEVWTAAVRPVLLAGEGEDEGGD